MPVMSGLLLVAGRGLLVGAEPPQAGVGGWGARAARPPDRPPDRPPCGGVFGGVYLALLRRAKVLRVLRGHALFRQGRLLGRGPGLGRLDGRLLGIYTLGNPAWAGVAALARTHRRGLGCGLPDASFLRSLAWRSRSWRSWRSSLAVWRALASSDGACALSCSRGPGPRSWRSGSTAPGEYERGRLGAAAALDTIEEVVVLHPVQVLGAGVPIKLLGQQVGGARIGTAPAADEQGRARVRELGFGQGQQAVGGLGHGHGLVAQGEPHHGPAADQSRQGPGEAAALCDQVRRRGADAHLQVAGANHATPGDGDIAADQG